MKNNYSHRLNLTTKHLTSLLILIIFILNTTKALSQKPNLKETTENAYAKYFNAERETIYLHFNKHTFLTNEPIWFKGYVYDKKNGIPYITTSNVYVTLYDKNGKEIETKLFYCENGMFTGSFDVGPSLATGYYFFKAYTNWMKNFKEDESFTSSPIQILNQHSNQETTNNKILDYDLQFLPEGGHCIADVTNSIGFKIINCSGESVEIEGIITDSNDKTIMPFKSNTFGMGKFDLLMKKGETYNAIYNINGKNYKTPLPQSEALGYSFSVNNHINTNMVYITLKTNKATQALEANKTYYLAIHQNNKSSITELNTSVLKTEYTIPISSKTLPYGVNTITLFDDELNPLLERMIFNPKNKDFMRATVEKTSSSSDSIGIKINLKDNKKIATSTSLSVSVLPLETKAINTNKSIISNLLIDPYINGSFENSEYYFNNFDRIKALHLDLVLLTQGWSKYSWEDIKNGEQELIIPFDKGVSITGTLNEPIDEDSNYQVHMFSLVNNINETKYIDNNKQFNFENYFIADSSKVHFNVLKNGKKITDPKLYARVISSGKTSLNQLFSIPNTCVFETLPIDTVNSYNDMEFEGELLDTINLHTKIVDKKAPLKNKKAYIGDAYSIGVKIDSIQERMYSFVSDIIDANGFMSYQALGRVIIINKRPISIKAGSSPLLIIDGANMGTNYDIIYNMPLNQVDEIYFNKSGLGYGVRGGAGVISIFLKKSYGVGAKGDFKRYANTLITTGGFSPQKEFYIPLFYLNSPSNFMSYGAIDWKPKLTTNEKGSVEFNIKNTSIKKLLLIIEGFSINGNLISETKELLLD